MNKVPYPKEASNAIMKAGFLAIIGGILTITIVGAPVGVVVLVAARRSWKQGRALEKAWKASRDG